MRYAYYVLFPFAAYIIVISVNGFLDDYIRASHSWMAISLMHGSNMVASFALGSVMAEWANGKSKKERHDSDLTEIFLRS